MYAAGAVFTAVAVFVAGAEFKDVAVFVAGAVFTAWLCLWLELCVHIWLYLCWSWVYSCGCICAGAAFTVVAVFVAGVVFTDVAVF